MPPKKPTNAQLAAELAALKASLAAQSQRAVAAEQKQAEPPAPAAGAPRRFTRHGGKSRAGELADLPDDLSSAAAAEEVVAVSEASRRDQWERFSTELFYPWLLQRVGAKVKVADRLNRAHMIQLMLKSEVRLPTAGKEKEEMTEAWLDASAKNRAAPVPPVFLAPQQPPAAGAGAGAQAAEAQPSQLPQSAAASQVKHSSDHDRVSGSPQQHQLLPLPTLTAATVTGPLQLPQPGAHELMKLASGQTQSLAAGSAPHSASFAPHQQGHHLDPSTFQVQQPLSQQQSGAGSGAGSTQGFVPRPLQCKCCTSFSGPLDDGSSFAISWRCPVCSQHGHLPADNYANRCLAAEREAESLRVRQQLLLLAQANSGQLAASSSTGSSSSSAPPAATSSGQPLQPVPSDAMSLAAAAAAAAEKVKRDRDSIGQVDAYLQAIAAEGPFMSMWTGEHAHDPMTFEQALLESSRDSYAGFSGPLPSKQLVEAIRKNKVIHLGLALQLLDPNAARPTIGTDGKPVVASLRSFQEFALIFSSVIAPALADKPRALQQWVLLMRSLLMLERVWGWSVAIQYVENVLAERISLGSEEGIGKISNSALNIVYANRRLDQPGFNAPASRGAPAHSPPSNGHTSQSNEACWNWNAGNPCGSSNGGPCGRLHVCRVCWGNHRSTACTSQQPPAQQQRGHSFGGGGGGSGNHHSNRRGGGNNNNRGGYNNNRKSNGGGGGNGHAIRARALAPTLAATTASSSSDGAGVTRR